MNWLTIAQQLFDYGYLIVLMILLWRVYINGRNRTAHTIQMESMISDVMRANAEGARLSAESARAAVDIIHNLVALQVKEPEEHEPTSSGD